MLRTEDDTISRWWIRSLIGRHSEGVAWTLPEVPRRSRDRDRDCDCDCDCDRDCDCDCDCDHD